jgi:zinc/manganese transport system ATP-binding protein
VTDAAIVVDDVTVAYDGRPAIRRINGGFHLGSLTALAGPNGAGKSSLLKALVGELRPTRGRIFMRGVARSDIGYLPQAAGVDRSFPLTVADTVLLGAWHVIGAFGGTKSGLREQAAQALTAVGLDGFASRYIGALSAGQFQRVLFARLILQDAKVILLDEPFNAIDAGTTRDLVEIVRGWHAGGRTVVAALHDFAQIRAYFPETLLLAREQIAWGPTSSALSDDNLDAARRIAESWHDAEHEIRGERR